MKKIIHLKVLIVGLRGLGIETAKNIILAGPNRVTLFDPEFVNINDLGSNFYLTEENIKNHRWSLFTKIIRIKFICQMWYYGRIEYFAKNKEL